jgi:hypothetical protein
VGEARGGEFVLTSEGIYRSIPLVAHFLTGHNGLVSNLKPRMHVLCSCLGDIVRKSKQGNNLLVNI